MSVPFNVNETIKRAESEYGLGKGEYFKVQEGANKIRLLSPCVGFQGSYKGTPKFKFVCWVIDRRDENKIKLYFMPQTVLDGIGSLQESDDYPFDEVPMPYDVAIMAKGAGTKEVQYSVVPSPKREPLTSAELEAFNEKPSVDEVIEKLKEKQADVSASQPEFSQTQQTQSGYEKARVAANSLLGGNHPVEANPEPSKEDVPFADEDVPW